MKMSKKLLKAVALVGCAVLLVAGSVAGTLAYLTSKTDTVTNTFTVGKVKITLDETNVDLYGAKVDDTRVLTNEYKLIPGHTYIKDPTIHVAAGSEPCYLFVKITDGLSAIQDDTTIAKQLENNGWTLVDGTTDIWSHAEIPTSTEIQDVKVFETIKIKANADVSGYAGEKLEVIAYAVQKDGFNTAKAAWDATKGSFAN